jgi:aryl-alcohol dehydrogenase-like predicted oxidoreductase
MIEKQQFGKTGHDSSRIIFGAAAFSNVSQADADRTIELVIENGVNHFDTAASYGDAELRLAPWLKDNRDQVFLATKTGQRTRQAAHDEIRRSLERMQVDHVDLIQLHNLVDPAEWETALGQGGALEAAIEARDEGLVNFIGVTGHGVTVAERHAQSLERFPFDSVLLPFSYIMMQNPQYAADFEALATTCAERGVAMQTIKAITRSPWAESATRDTATWYDPLRDQEGIDLAVHWVLGRPGVF